MTNFNFDSNITETYKDASSVVITNNNIEHIFRTTVQQGCILSQILLNMCLEHVMLEAINDYNTSISMGGRTLWNVEFADYINVTAGIEAEREDQITRLESV